MREYKNKILGKYDKIKSQIYFISLIGDCLIRKPEPLKKCADLTLKEKIKDAYHKAFTYAYSGCEK